MIYRSNLVNQVITTAKGRQSQTVCPFFMVVPPGKEIRFFFGPRPAKNKLGKKKPDLPGKLFDSKKLPKSPRTLLLEFWAKLPTSNWNGKGRCA